MIGYEYLRQHLKLPVFPLARQARVAPVTRLREKADGLEIPKHVAPQSDRPLDHLLFALKHEGTQLPIVSEAMQHIAPTDLLASLRQSPNGVYIRKACFLWECFTGERLSDLPAIGGPTVGVFDPERYVTVPARRDVRWRVAFNGLGTPQYCATVERTDSIRAAEAADVLGQLSEFASTLSEPLRDRALRWAYLHETESSFAIEREVPHPDKARAFARVLEQAAEGRSLSEDYLVELQNAAMTNPLVRESAFRGRQNWLHVPERGAAGVTYVPPPPDLAQELMQHLMALANNLPRQIDPVTAAAVISFGFVFVHPFLDGNGRLSRFLFHHALCRSGRRRDGLLLPVSIAMQRNERQYLATLQTYSVPAREQWTVRWIGDSDYDFRFNGSPAIYRYWDATACVDFGHRMATEALEHDLRRQTELLADYDAVYRAVDERFDVRGPDLAAIVLRCFDQRGRVSNNTRKQFADTVPAEAFDFVAERVAERLATRAAEATGGDAEGLTNAGPTSR